VEESAKITAQDMGRDFFLKKMANFAEYNIIIFNLKTMLI
jgi:hypothetical protein